MTLQERLAESIKARILSPDGFAETHEVEGKAVSCVLTPPLVAPSDQAGVYTRQRSLYARTADVAPPEPGQALVIDGERWSVESVMVFQDLVRINLYRSGS